MAVLFAAACGKSGDKAGGSSGGGGAKPYAHDDPPFVLDVPAGFEPAPEFESAEGGRTLRFDGPHASDYLAVTWTATDGRTAVERRDSLAAADEHVVGKGDLPGGGAWVEYEALQGGVTAFLVVGSAMVSCQSDSKPVLTACKTLRPK